MKIRKIPEDYDKRMCLIGRCRNTSQVIISTSPDEFGLCEQHWTIYCEKPAKAKVSCDCSISNER